MPRKTITSIARIDLMLVLAAGLVTALICAMSFDKDLSDIGDNAEFIILARSIVSGQGYRMINHPSAMPNTKYPPGFPMMLAGWIKLFGDSVVGMKVLCVVTLVVASMLAYLMARRYMPVWASLGSVLVVITSWNVIKYSFDVLSDVPYMMVSLLGLYLLEREGKVSKVSGLLMGVGSFLVRTVGVSLVLATWIWLFLKKQRKLLLVSILVFGSVAGAWTLRNMRVSGNTTKYAQVFLLKNPYNEAQGQIDFESFARRMGINFKQYTTYFISYNIAPTLLEKLGGETSPSSRIVASLLFFISMLGIYSLRRSNPLIPAYLCFYIAVYLIWPEVWTGERFMLPISPLVAIGLFLGLVEISRFFRWRKGIPVAVVWILVVTNLFTLIPYMGRQRGYSPGWQNYFEIARWAKENTSENSVFLCRSPFLFYLTSSRKTIGYPITTDVEKIKRYLWESRPNYIVVENFSGTYSTTGLVFGPVLREMTDQIAVVYATGQPISLLLEFNPREASD